jgi:hypothetical protein
MSAAQHRCAADTAGAVRTWVCFTRKARSPSCRFASVRQLSGGVPVQCVPSRLCGGASPFAGAYLFPTPGSPSTPASGAADSSALGGHAILVGPSERVVRFRDHGLREGFRSVSPSCSHSWGAAHGLVRRDGGALVAPAPRRSPSSCSGRRGVNRALPAAPRAATTCRLTSAMQLTPLRGP